jgi:4-amino-4-deoxy-L-arabinose transferase-like glycosyltransferase
MTAREWWKSGQAGERHTLWLRLSVLLLSSLVILYSLGKRILNPWDEAIYSEIAKEMAYQHRWLTPNFNQQPWFEKPPLFMWVTAVCYKIFGISEFASRMLPALCGIATVWLTFELGRRLRDNWTGALAAVVLLSGSIFLGMSRDGMMDVPLAACFTLTAYGYVRARNGDRRWWYLIGLAVGLGCMLKGAGGIVAPLALGLALLWDGSLSQTYSREFRNSVLLALGIVLPWHLAMVILHGRTFVDEYIGYHVLARISGVEGHPGPWYFYLGEYWHVFRFFSVIAVVGVFLQLTRKKTWAIAISFLLVVTVLYSLVGTKLFQYVVPGFPFLCLLAALAMRELGTSKKYLSACAVILVGVCWALQWQDYKQIYKVEYEQPARVAPTALEVLTQLTTEVRDDDVDTNKSPLIVCLDGLDVPKQQTLFYSNRPVIQAFLSISTANPDIQRRYVDPVPLHTVVNPNPTPIITWNSLYPELAYSTGYKFVPVAQRGPFLLGLISLKSSDEATGF